MVPAIKKAPFDYIFAFLLSSSPFIGSFWVKPAETAWIDFGVGIAMMLGVVIAALRPVREEPER